jgi:glutathione S-transferase
MTETDTPSARHDLVLWWSSRSPFVRKVMIAAHELGLAGRIETRAEVVTPTAKSDALRAVHPLGQLPVLERPDGAPVYDSHVICEYLDSLADKRLVPAAGPSRIAVLQRQALADAMLDKALRALDERFRPEGTRSAERTEAALRDIGFALDRLETEVRAGELAGDLGDLGAIAVASTLAYLDFRFAAECRWRDGRPALAAWFTGVGQRPSMLATTFVG